jgi:archaetidylinositol phosphate synthase
LGYELIWNLPRNESEWIVLQPLCASNAAIALAATRENLGVEDKMSGVQLRIEGSRLAVFQEAQRIQGNFIHRSEKRLLLWLAERTPAKVNSDHLTAIGAAGMLLSGASYALAPYTQYGLVLACVFLAVNWLGDSLDGTLARHRNRQRPRYGFYVDHVLDCFGVTALLGGLGLGGFMQPLIAGWVLVAYLLLSSEIFLATYALGRFELSYLGLGPTELRILLCVGNLYVFFQPSVHPFGSSFSLFDFGGICGAIGMAGIAIGSAVRHGRALYVAERLQ